MQPGKAAVGWSRGWWRSGPRWLLALRSIGSELPEELPPGWYPAMCIQLRPPPAAGRLQVRRQLRKLPLPPAGTQPVPAATSSHCPASGASGQEHCNKEGSQQQRLTRRAPAVLDAPTTPAGMELGSSLGEDTAAQFCTMVLITIYGVDAAGSPPQQRLPWGTQV